MHDGGIVAHTMAVGGNAVAIVATQAITGTYPDIAPAILGQCLDLLMGQPIAAGKVHKTVASIGCRSLGDDKYSKKYNGIQQMPPVPIGGCTESFLTASKVHRLTLKRKVVHTA